MNDKIFKWALLLFFLGLILVAVWEHIARIFDLELEVFLVRNKGVLISLGTLVLVSFLAFWTTFLTNKFADRREESNRKIQSELKLSEFRQKWIDELRSDLALLISISTEVFEIEIEESKRKAGVLQMKELEAKIRLRLNPHEPPAIELLSSVENLIESTEKITGCEMYTSREKMAVLATHYLKNEWDELRNKLGKAEGGRVEKNETSHRTRPDARQSTPSRMSRAREP